MHLLKRIVAFALTFTLCTETLLMGGVVSAVALSPDDTPSQQAGQLSVEADTAAGIDAVANSADGTQAGSQVDQPVALHSENAVVPVSVSWLDGDSADSRMPIRVGLYASRNIMMDDQVAYYRDDLIYTITLSADNSWYTEVELPVLSADVDVARDFYIKEISTYDGYSDAQGRYKVISRDAAEGDSAYAPLLRNWPENDSAPRMVSADASQGFAYRVTYARNSALGSFEVVNQRIGFAEAAINRTWLDEGADASARPASSFTLTNPSGAVKFVYDAGGLVYARVSGQNDYALYKKDASGNLTPLTTNFDGADVTVSAARNSLTMDADLLGGTSAYSIVNLPKYDAQGSILDWTVEQNWAGEHGDYQISGGEAEETVVAPWHQGDQLTFSFANRRKGVRSLALRAMFDGLVDGDKHPDLTFRLYRYYEDASGKSDLSYAGQKTLAAIDTAAGELTFDNLDAYTSAGAEWNYIVIEVVPEGYVATSGKGDLAVSDFGFKDSAEWIANNGVSLPAEAAAWSMGPAMGFPKDGVATTVTFKNTRAPGAATLAGKVHWADRDNEFGTRPASVSLKLTRAYQDGSPAGAVELQTSDPNAPNYLVWTSKPLNGSDVWAYEIRNLEKWAPDGKPWKYTVAEGSLDSQYEIKAGTDNGGSCDSTAGELPSFANELKRLATTKVSGAVVWDDRGSGLADAIDPATCGIELKVFRSVAGGSEELAANVGADGESELALSWSKVGNGTWVYSLDGLSKYDQNGREYTYRIEPGGEVSGWRFAGYGDDGSFVYEVSRQTPGGDGDEGRSDAPGGEGRPDASGGSGGFDDTSSSGATSPVADAADDSVADNRTNASAMPATGDCALLLQGMLACLVLAMLALSLCRLRMR